MNLVLDDNYRIISNDEGRNFILEKLYEVEDRKTQEIKKVFKVKGYYGRIEHAISSYAKSETIADMDLININDLLEHMKRMDNKIEEVLRESNIDWSKLKKVAASE